MLFFFKISSGSSLKFLLLSVCLSEESEASDESDNLSDLDGDPVVSNNNFAYFCVVCLTSVVVILFSLCPNRLSSLVFPS